ncbi:uncharacterized protein LOC125499728 [Athalia rosae]|uniref:uncharacterized protein LOC125499728 n=1 Tax=Athalia rosae TaxID=37344 RepID=UPI0020348FD5|nr:uncharacterized protein LOC125499728 [Athalia rosae]
MKFLLSLALILLVVNSSMQLPEYKNCNSEFLAKNPSIGVDCGVVTCHEDNTMTATGCGIWRCQPGQQIGYTEADSSKPFPSCCGGPICA